MATWRLGDLARRRKGKGREGKGREKIRIHLFRFEKKKETQRIRAGIQWAAFY
jgi:hypothetical protein